MTDNPFADPAAATGVDWSTLVGRLLVIEPHSVELAVQTTLGPKDAVRADVHVIDTDPAQSYDDVLIFPRVLLSQVRSKLGLMVLGRMEQGVAKPGQSAPWRLAEATAADQAQGLAWLRQRKSPTFAKAATVPDAAPPF